MIFEKILGRHDEARATFGEATTLIDQQMPQENSGDWGLAWHDWIRCQIVLEEAELMIQDGS